ncbi:hypothetical protein BD779DRAFT_1595913, partial [Infundibulicybe gibba]
MFRIHKHTMLSVPCVWIWQQQDCQALFPVGFYRQPICLPTRSPSKTAFRHLSLMMPTSAVFMQNMGFLEMDWAWTVVVEVLLPFRSRVVWSCYRSCGSNTTLEH